MKYSYYPGCSLHSVHKGYDVSCRAVLEKLGCELIEIDDWNCCGATIYMSIKEFTAFAIAARNLAIAELSGWDIVTPCSSCYTVLNKTHRSLKEKPELLEKVNDCLSEAGLTYNCSVRVRHPLDVLINDIGVEIIRLKIVNHLTDLNIANYYGCQIVRPDKVFDDNENPTSMENLFESVGANVVYFPYKLRCCGGMLMTTFEESARKLSDEILESAKENNADCIVTTCPLCQMNLEAYQDKINKNFNKSHNMPILFFTQVLGVALGIPDIKLGMDQNFIECKQLKKISLSKILNGIST